MRSRETPTAALAAMVVVAALGVWSCGGSNESPTAPALVPDIATPAAPVAAQATGEEGEGSVTSSCRTPRKITICHKGQTQQVSLLALFAHLRHGDRIGACAPAAVTCPCFSSAGLADVAAQCSVPPIASCGEPYSLNLFCAAGGGSGTVGNLGYFEARLGAGTCSTTTADSLTGTTVTTPMPVTAAQFEACKQAIVGSTYYPASCPR